MPSQLLFLQACRRLSRFGMTSWTLAFLNVRKVVREVLTEGLRTSTKSVFSSSARCASSRDMRATVHQHSAVTACWAGNGYADLYHVTGCSTTSRINGVSSCSSSIVLSMLRGSAAAGLAGREQTRSVLETARFLKDDFLQQNSFTPYDKYCELPSACV